MPLTALREEASCTTATEFSGYVKTLPIIRPAEKLVLSQVLVPPLVQEYALVKKEWMKQKLWKQEDFIEVRDESCSEEMKPRIIEALHTFLEMRMDAHIKELKSRKDHNWKRLLVESFETTLSDPKVSSNVQTYVVPNSDPAEALRGQLGLKTVMASDIFVIGVFRSRTMLELPTYLEQERINSHPGFPKSPYWWGLEMDRYAVDGSPYFPDWMSQSQPASKKKKCSTGKLSKWTEGYGMTYSAFGYGNETVLCNDPHLTPWTDLDDTGVNQQAEKSSNTSVKECRIGPWVFPIQVTKGFLPEGTPLLYYYGRGYWVTTRASQALATLTDEREALLKQEQEQLRQENDGLRRCLQILHQQHGGAALQLVQASLDAGRAIAALSPPDKPQQLAPRCETPKPEIRQHSLYSPVPNGVNMHANNVALAVLPLQGVEGTSQAQPALLNSNHAAKAAKQPDAVDGLNNARADDNAVGQLQAALGQVATNAPRAFSGTTLPEACSEVQYLRQSYGSLLQRMTTLEANLHGMEQQLPLPPDSSFLNQSALQHAQRGRAASPTDAHDFVATENQGELNAAAEHLPTQMPNVSQQQHGMHSVHSMQPPAVIDDAARRRRAKLDKRNERNRRRKAASREASRAPEQQAADASPAEAARAKQIFSKTSQPEQAGKKSSAVRHLWGAVVRQQWDLAVPAASGGNGQQAAPLKGASHGSGMLSRTENLVAIGDRQAHKPVLPQGKAVPGDGQRQRAVKRSAGKGNNQQPKQQKKRKVTETAATAGADSGSQPEAAGIEAATAADGKAGPLEDRPIQWGGKQKRKHARLAPADGARGLPDQARRAPQQKLLPPFFSSDVPHPSGCADAATADAAAASGISEAAAVGLSKALGTTTGCADGSGDDDDDKDALASDKGSEKFELQVAELKDLASAVPHHRPAGTWFVVVDEAEVTFHQEQQVVKRHVLAPQWERFLVHWQPNTQAQAQQEPGADDASEPSRMCPWELFEEGLDSQQAAAEGPALDNVLLYRLLQAVHALAASHHFAAFHDLLPPDQAYPASDTGVPMYYNTLVALPMSLSLMEDRLQQRYYRQLEGWLGDVATLEGNARAFCGDDSPVTEAATDLARRLRAAADGGKYEEGLSDDEDEDDGDDAEISDLEKARETHQLAAPADDHMQNCLNQEQEGGLDSMNSSAQQPWGAEARRSKRSSRSRRQLASPPIPSDSTAVLRDPRAGPYHSRLRSRMQATFTHEEPASSSRHSGQAAWDNVRQQEIADGLAAGRQTRSLRSRDRGDTIGHCLGPGAAAASLDGAAGGSAQVFTGGIGNRDGGARVQRHDEQPHQQMTGGRALRSKRGQLPQPDEAQLQSDDDAQLAKALQESMLTALPVRRSGRNTRAAEHHLGLDSRHKGKLDVAAGPSSAADQMSPSSSRETRAQQRASRAQQMHMHETSPEPADTHMAKPEGQFVRRSQRHQTRASSASVEASQRALDAAQRTDAHMQRVDLPQGSVDGSETQVLDAARQGVSGIKLTLRRPSGSARQRHDDPADAVHRHDETPANNVRTASVRVSLRPRRS